MKITNNHLAKSESSDIFLYTSDSSSIILHYLQTSASSIFTTKK